MSVPLPAEDSVPPSAPMLYVTDLGYDSGDPADLFDLAYLLRSSRHDLLGVCLTRGVGDGSRVVDALTMRAGRDVALIEPGEGLEAALRKASVPLNLVVVGGWGAVADLMVKERTLFREKVARLFVVGGHANDYTALPRIERLPIDPRLKERNPERFTSEGNRGLAGDEERRAWATLITSGEGVIWLPRDICLWRYAAPGVLSDGGVVAAFLLRELFWSHLQAGITDRYDAADAPVLLSTLPAFLLALQPDPFAWMRLFRVVTARVEIDDQGTVSSLSTRTDTPNLYAVIAIDGQALGKLMTVGLRDRPLT